VKGREGDLWLQIIHTRPPAELVQTLACAGFAGIYLNRAAFADRGAGFEAALASLLHADPLVSADRRLSFFNLTNYCNGLRQSCTPEEWSRREQRALHPIAWAWREGFYGLEGAPPEEPPFRWCAAEGRLDLRNALPYPRTIALGLSFRGAGARPAHLYLRSELFAADLDLRQEEHSISRLLVLPPGSHAIHFRCDGEKVVNPSDPRSLVFRVTAFSLDEIEPSRGEDVTGRRRGAAFTAVPGARAAALQDADCRSTTIDPPR
jgi:phosphoglycerol transferase